MENSKKSTKVIIAGSRNFSDFDYLRECCDEVLSMYNNVEVVSGTARGADKLGEEYARQRGYRVVRFPADWDRYGKSAGAIRNSQMAEYADVLIVFWDGESRGTKNMIDIATKKGLHVIVKQIKNKI